MLYIRELLLITNFPFCWRSIFHWGIDRRLCLYFTINAFGWNKMRWSNLDWIRKHGMCKVLYFWSPTWLGYRGSQCLLQSRRWPISNKLSNFQQNTFTTNGWDRNSSIFMDWREHRPSASSLVSGAPGGSVSPEKFVPTCLESNYSPLTISFSSSSSCWRPTPNCKLYSALFIFLDECLFLFVSW